MEQALGKQGITEQEKVLGSKNRDYADRILEKYEGKIKQAVHGIFKGATNVSLGDRQDIVINVCHALWKLLDSGKFKGKHKEASIKACISAIARNKKNDFLRKFITDKKLRAYEPPPRDNTLGGGIPEETESWLEICPPYFLDKQADKDVAREYEEKEGDEFIARETKYPEIIDSYRKGYSMKVIARTYGLTNEQVKKRIQREKKRLAKIAKQQGWRYSG